MSSSAYGDPATMQPSGGGTAPASAPAISSGGAPQLTKSVLYGNDPAQIAQYLSQQWSDGGMGGTPPQPQGYNTAPVAPQGSQVQFHPPAAESIVGGSGGGGFSGGGGMSILGGLPGADPFSGSSGFGTGSSTGSSTGSGSSQQSTQMIPGMQGIYSQLLGMNSNNYQNVMNAYQGGKNWLQQNLPGVYAGYDQLGGAVQNVLGMGQVLGQNGNWGVAAPAAQAIGNTYNQQVGTNTQQMTDAGLGNTTVKGNLNNQAAQAASFSYGQLGSQLADKAAGYMSDVGKAGLASQMQGLGAMTGLTQAALGPLGQQFSNTAGSLTGSFGSSQYSNQSQQQAQNRNQQQSNSGGGGNQGGGNNLPPGVPGGPGGGAAPAAPGSGGGGGMPGAPGYDPVGAYGTGGGGNNSFNAIGNPPASPGGIGTYNMGGMIGGATTAAGGGGYEQGAAAAVGGGTGAAAFQSAYGPGSGEMTENSVAALQQQYPGLSDGGAQALSKANEQMANGESTPYQIILDSKNGVVARKDSNGVYQVMGLAQARASQ